MLPQQKKAIIREDARRRRATLTGRAELSSRIWQHLIELPHFAAATRVFAYASTSTEVETLQFLANASAGGRLVALPCSAPGKLTFFEVNDFLSLAPGNYGILE